MTRPLPLAPLLLLGLVLLAPAPSARAAPAPLTLETSRLGAGRPDGFFVAEQGRTLLVYRGSGPVAGRLVRWDMATGRRLGPLPGPEGAAVAAGSGVAPDRDGRHLVVPTAERVLVLDLLDLAWVHGFDFAGASAAVLDPARDRLILSRPEDGRNWLYTIDLASGERNKVARLRGADRDNEHPRFTRMHLFDDGVLLGIDDRAPAQETITVDSETWRLLRPGRPTTPWTTVLPNGYGVAVTTSGQTHQLFYAIADLAEGGTYQRSGVIEGFRAPISHVGTAGAGVLDRERNRVLVHCSRGLFWISLEDGTVEALRVGKGVTELEGIEQAGWDPVRRELILFGADRWRRDRMHRLVSRAPGAPGPRQAYGFDFHAPGRLVAEPGGRSFVSVPGPWQEQGRRYRFGPRGFSQAFVPAREAPIAVAPDGSPVTRSWITRIDAFTKRPVRDRAKLFLRVDGEARELWAPGDDWPKIAHAADTFRFSPSGDSLAVVTPHVVVVFRARDQEVIRRFGAELATTPVRGRFAEARFVGEDALVVGHDDHTGPDERPVYALRMLDVGTGKVRWRRESPGPLAPVHVTDETILVVAAAGERGLEWRRRADGAVIRRRALDFGPAVEEISYRATGWALDEAAGELRVWVDGRGLRRVDVATGEPVGSLVTLSGGLEGLHPIGETGFLVGGSPDGLALHHAVTAERRAEIRLFEADLEWVALTPDHRFDATGPGQSRLHFRQGDRIVPLSLLFEQAYTPRLVPRLLAGAELPALDLAVVPAPPTVRLSVADFETRGLTVEDDVGAIATHHDRVRLRIEARSGSSLLDEVRLFHNGKALPMATRGLVVENDVPDPEAVGASRRLEREVLLLPGENRFRAVAVNREGVESSPAELRLDYRAVDPEAGRGVRLFLVVVGVNRYENPKYDLNYAVPDARAFREAVLERAAGLYAEVEDVLLTDDGVSRERILAALDRAAEGAGARDTFIFYFAGHGVMSGGADPRFYLVPPSVTQLYGDDAGLRERAVSAADLQRAAREIAARRQLFVLDACQSAGAIQDLVALRGGAEEKAIATLARSTGTHWLAATGSEQFAGEFDTLGHGAFTYALLQGLDGKADTGDGQVTVGELDAFLQRRVPELTREHRGSTQFPASYGRGQDFPVGLVGEQE